MPGLNPEKSPQDSPNYIGATNWSSLQTQYTPYQLEQATTRDDQGNIFWNPEENISSIPASEPFKPPKNETISSDNLVGTNEDVQYPDVPGAADFETRNAVAEQYLSGMDKAIDDIDKQQEATQAEAVQSQEGVVSGLKDRLASIVGATTRSDFLRQSEAKLEEQKNALKNIRQKIVDATNAMNEGIIYEENRPVRASLLQGRSFNLQKQQQAKIESLKGVAELIKGNIDEARAYADRMVTALGDDLNDQEAALLTLLDLENADLITLRVDEKETINRRRQQLVDEATRLQTNKDTLVTMAENYPDSFAQSGATFMDTPEEALKKMLPFLSERERLELQQLREQVEATSRSNRGSGGGGGSDILSLFDEEESQRIAAAYDAGLSVEDTVRDLQSVMGGPLDTKQVNAVKNYFSTQSKPGEGDQPLSIKDVSDAGWDVQAHPEYVGKTMSEILQMQNNQSEGEGWLSKGWNWVTGLFGGE